MVEFTLRDLKHVIVEKDEDQNILNDFIESCDLVVENMK